MRVFTAKEAEWVLRKLSFIERRAKDEAEKKLQAVRPGTAAHRGRQFLLGISLERKVPETAFPDKPVMPLPAYFDKFRTTPATEADLKLLIKADLALLGESE